MSKIAYLSTFYPFRGGIAQFNASLYKALVENGHEVNAYTFSTQYPNFLFPGKTQLVTEKDDAEVIPSKRILSTVNPLSYISAASSIKKFNPDILIMKFWLPFFGPSLGYVSGKLKNQGTKCIAILDNAIPHEKRPGDALFTHYFLNRISGAVVMSDTVKSDLEKLKPTLPYEFIRHPVYDHFGEAQEKTEARKKLGLPHDKRILLFFGLIRDYKGLDWLIKAMKKLDDRYILVAAGEVYGDETEYIKLAEKEGVSDRCKFFFRYIDDPEVATFFSAADVNVLPYKSATQSGILSIAWHFELPVIVTRTGSLAADVESYKMGRVVEENFEEKLPIEIQQYFENDESGTFQDNIKVFKNENSWLGFGDKLVAFSKAL